LQFFVQHTDFLSHEIVLLFVQYVYKFPTERTYCLVTHLSTSVVCVDLHCAVSAYEIVDRCQQFSRAEQV
jgi:hypothetical protein